MASSRKLREELDRRGLRHVPIRLSGCMDLCAYKNVVHVEGDNGEPWFGRIDHDSDVAELAARITDWHHGWYARLAGPHLTVGDGEPFAQTRGEWQRWN